MKKKPGDAICSYSECTNIYTKRNMQHKTCRWQCAIAYTTEIKEQRAAKSKRKAIKEFKANDKSDLTKKAQAAFNKFIRLRDGKMCITCKNTTRQMHAGHYRPVGRNHSLRFNEFNCHSQCSICNNHLSGNLVPYREAIINLYGLTKVEELESDNNPKSYSVDELQEIIEKYKLKIKDFS